MVWVYIGVKVPYEGNLIMEKANLKKLVRQNCINMKIINKHFAFGDLLLALLKIKAKCERLIANNLTSYYLSFCFLNFDILFNQKKLNAI
jgi:hypothetical protein